ncbi:MAG: signal peptide peptidase SppA [Rhodothermales bacterium]|nr:signal peptide peptidase SppA [Rhodothermales bacterium]
MRFFSTLVASVLGSLIALGLVIVFMFIFLIGLAFSGGEQAPRINRNSTLVFKLSGSIPENVSGDPFMQAFADESPFDLRDFIESTEKAASDDRIDALWIQVSGSALPWATAREVRNAILTFKESGKPVIASSSNYTMSENAYFIASAADKVYASPEALFEFNGFYVAAEFYKRLLDKLDVEPQIVRAGKYKGAIEPWEREDLSPANREQTVALIRAFESVFYTAIEESRGLSRSEVVNLAQNSAMMTARDAVDAGLVDDLLFRDEIETEIKTVSGFEDLSEDLELVTMSTYVRAVNVSKRGSRSDNIAIVYADGVIVPGGSDSGNNPFGGSSNIGSDTFRKAMQRATDSDAVNAIVVRINSPGGVAPAADEMRHEIELAAKVKPVIISMGSVAASGGYWMATAADSILADPLTITGSIGVYSLFFDVGDLFESKLGITYDIVETNPYADMYSGLRPFTADERRLAQRSVDETYGSFLEIVGENRGMTTEEVHEVAQGRVWSGADALEVGLVDRLASLQDAVDSAVRIAELDQDDYGIIEYPKPPTFFEQFENALNVRVRSIALKAASPLELETLNRLNLFDDLLSDYGTVQARMPFDIVVK